MLSEDRRHQRQSRPVWCTRPFQASAVRPIANSLQGAMPRARDRHGDAGAATAKTCAVFIPGCALPHVPPSPIRRNRPMCPTDPSPHLSHTPADDHVSVLRVIVESATGLAEG